jgi:hypothetical protein
MNNKLSQNLLQRIKQLFQTEKTRRVTQVSQGVIKEIPQTETRKSLQSLRGL